MFLEFLGLSCDDSVVNIWLGLGTKSTCSGFEKRRFWILSPQTRQETSFHLQILIKDFRE